MKVSFMPHPLYPMERAPGTHCVGGWVGPRAGHSYRDEIHDRDQKIHMESMKKEPRSLDDVQT
jgi:hypothetical protein